MITLDTLNTQSAVEAYANLEQCCVSKVWISRMVESRPFDSLEDLIDTAASIWYDECKEKDFKQAFKGHPKIGDVESLTKKFANTKDWANNEQSMVSEANTTIINELSIANGVYEKRFGYIFIVSASGKSASEMLAIVKERIHNRKKDEIFVAMNEQHKITVIRLAKLVEGVSELNLGSQITTHALDTSKGLPAMRMLITLKGLKNNKWKPISIGITNDDGRISDVLPAGKTLEPNTYLMSFNTQEYFNHNNVTGFYPEVSIKFTVTDDSHYHIPLLINPYGYSTYRGS